MSTCYLDLLARDGTSGAHEGFITPLARSQHGERRRAILAAHPDVEGLIGSDARTFIILVALVICQIGIAACIAQSGSYAWWIALVVAFCFGAFANHALLVIIHDAAHNLIFKKPLWNKWAAILADTPNIVPTAVAFRCYHLKHHSHLGDYDYDADLPSAWEARLFGRSWYGKALWMFFFPLLQLFRLGRMQGTVPLRGPWIVINAGYLVISNLVIVLCLGPTALFYLFASFWFSLGGLHPLGARLIQEHFTFDASQETFDYYGPLNLLALNAGFHNEHHDFPNVPWTRLPQLKRMADEFYDTLVSHTSWSKLLARFIFDPRYSLHCRIDRRGPVARQPS